MAKTNERLPSAPPEQRINVPLPMPEYHGTVLPCGPLGAGTISSITRGNLKTPNAMKYADDE